MEPGEERQPPPLPPPLPRRRGGSRGKRRPRKKRRTGRFLLLVIGIPVAVLLGLVSCVLLFDAFTKELPVQEADRAAVVTAAHVAGWMEDFEPAAAAERFVKRRYLDGSHELDYEYDDPDDDIAPYIACTVSFDKKRSDALATFTGQDVGTKLSTGVMDVEFIDRNDLFRWGRRSRCCLVRHEDGRLVGNYFICLRGARVFYLLLIGLYFDDPEALAEFLEPVLKRFDTWSP